MSDQPDVLLAAYRDELAGASANDAGNTERFKLIKAEIADQEKAVKAEIARLETELRLKDDDPALKARIDSLKAILGREGDEPETTTKAPVAERAVRKTAKKGT